MEKAAAKLGYRPNLSARRLRAGGASTFAIFSSMPFAVSAGPSRLGFMMEIAASASLAAMEHGIALMLVPPVAIDDLSRLHLDIDGAIVIEPSSDDHYLSMLVGRGVPVVSVGKVPGRLDGVEEIDLHARETAELLLDHLATRSSRVALVIGDAERTSYVSAEDAYRRFADLYDWAPIILRLPESGGERVATEACSDLLTQHPELDGLLVMVDTFASGAVRAAHALGKRVPLDLRVATRYNGIRALECEPPLTAVDLGLDAVGTIAVERLLEKLGIVPEATRAKVSKQTLIARQSTSI